MKVKLVRRRRRMNQTYEENALFEHKFWLRVLEDHAQFLLDALAPKRD